ncbi:hypothetical protein A2943_02505 [Candidatus Adlerbacteria bacterium RIFCSPLOWO2_01_FULL_51_16]|uniref:SpaA-like prealbumin fold domain-containing protein n=1 Tax=Candidatus Adlerbacteria bacterium RIFCSPLOWO2_01_FULL_51_16 TaxID=1797243 RepID=A0A1F4XGM4_9BACT|nr:MAG: hypothetical protein A2943_02505 [Candidatus Adlerbacteria bacterium RIFCSPLOWO2_01_FULL_51_16]
MRYGRHFLFSGALLFGLFCSFGAPQAFAADTNLTLAKQVINDGGGTYTGSPGYIQAYNPDTQTLVWTDGSTTTQVVPPGLYDLWEDLDSVPSGYESRWNCAGNSQPEGVDSVRIMDGEQVTCTAVNDDIAPTLKLVKIVNGGTAQPSDWQLTAAGNGSFTDTGGSDAFHNVKADVIYTLTESGPSNYTPGSWDCDFGHQIGNTINLVLAEVVTCTITNTYSPPATLDPVIIIPGILGSWEKNGVWLIDPVFGVYNDLIDTLAANGYVEEQDLFTFPYNWRESNVETAVLLQEKINEVQEICDCQKIDLVAHSMGGLAARQYIQSDSYENDVDQMVFLGTPHLGAPKTYLMWEAGQYTNNPLELGGQLFNLIFKSEARKNGYSDVFSYVRIRPIISVQELLPIYDYIFDGRNLREYPDNYPRNVFLEDLRGSVNLLTQRVQVENIIGSVEGNTITGYTIVPSDELPKWEHGKPTNGGILRGDGDGTVPFLSSVSVAPEYQTINVDHVTLPSSAARPVYEILTGQEPETIVSNGIQTDLPLLWVILHSPIDMQIIAPDGKRLGKDFLTNQEFDEIPDAFYSGFLTDNEYAVIVNPLPGEYRVKTIGTGNGGEYTIVADYIDTQGDVEAETSGITAPEQIIESTFTLSTANRALNILYRWDGFLQPINDTAHKITANTSVFKGGSTAPIKLQLKRADGTVIQAASAPQWLEPQKGAAMNASVDETVYSDPATTGSSFTWDSTTQQYIYNWSTKGVKAGYWYKIFVKLDDGTTQWTYIGLR